MFRNMFTCIFKQLERQSENKNADIGNLDAVMRKWSLRVMAGIYQVAFYLSYVLVLLFEKFRFVYVRDLAIMRI